MQIDKDESLQLNIGSGGTVGTFSGSSAQKYYAGSGGYTQVVRNKDQSVIVTATGGNGGQGSYRENNTSLNFASGNGVGGGYTYQGAPTYAGKGASGTAGTGFIFNDQSLGLAGGGGGGSIHLLLEELHMEQQEDMLVLALLLLMLHHQVLAAVVVEDFQIQME